MSNTRPLTHTIDHWILMSFLINVWITKLLKASMNRWRTEPASKTVHKITTGEAEIYRFPGIICLYIAMRRWQVHRKRRLPHQGRLLWGSNNYSNHINIESNGCRHWQSKQNKNVTSIFTKTNYVLWNIHLLYSLLN